MAEKHLTDGTTALAAQPRVIKIEAAEKSRNAQLRVAAYTRVSSDSDDQLNSFAAQNRYYAELISGKAEWRMVDIYADEGITGTSAAKREDFQRMMADCRRGLIGQILVKSISRFARNTKDCLEAVRELNRKEKVTVILITHYMEEVIHADRVYVMDSGNVVMQGNPKEIFSQVDTLKAYGLDVPQVTLLAYELKKSGVDVPDGILTTEELVSALCQSN